MPDTYAAIDIGTNTLLMLVAEIDDNKIVRILHDEHAIARLGENVDASRNIQSTAISRAGEILKHYSNLCVAANVTKTRIVATSALRDAGNNDFVLDQLKKYISADIEIISGEEEAELSFMGTVEDDSESMVIDIGGGSTEFIFGKNNLVYQKISFQIGAVRLTERFFKHYPPDPAQINLLSEYIRGEFKNKLPDIQVSRCYAVAGTPTTIATVVLGQNQFDPEKIDKYVLTKKDIEQALSMFVEKDLEYLINNLNIHPGRADVITAGTIILIESLNALNKSNCLVSTKGLRYGVLKSMLNKN